MIVPAWSSASTFVLAANFYFLLGKKKHETNVKISALRKVWKPLSINEWLLIMITLIMAIIYQALYKKTKTKQCTESFPPGIAFNLCSNSLRRSSCSRPHTDRARRGAGAGHVCDVAEPDFGTRCIRWEDPRTWSRQEQGIHVGWPPSTLIFLIWRREEGGVFPLRHQ